MSSDPAHELWEIFEKVVGLAPSEQDGALDELCRDNPSLRSKVAGMLAADRQASSFIDQPIAGRHGLHELTATSVLPVVEGRLEPGSRVGPYRIIRLLDEGGMGAVYLAARDDDSFNRRVALKLVRAGMETAHILERLKTERRILASLNHPYISRLYDGGSTSDGRPYFVLEYIEGEPIDLYCRKNALSIDERLELFIKVCSVVQFAHQNLVIHRDLKPRNILVTRDGDPKLLDFGIAKLVNPEISGESLDPTDPILRIATPNYASPEQLRGDLVTTSSDIYSLGVLLYKLLTGHLPFSFSGMTLAEIESRLASSTPLPPSVVISHPVADDEDLPEGQDSSTALHPPDLSETKVAKLPKDLDAIVLKALRTVPRRRYASAEQLAEDIRRFRQGFPVNAHSGHWRYRTGKFLLRHRTATAATAALALLLVGFAVAFGMQARRVAAERDLAELERDKKSQVLSLLIELFRLSSPYAEPGQELTVREAVERGLGTLDDSLGEQPAVRAELLYAAGSILFDLGANQEARDHFSEVIDLQRQANGGPGTLAAATSALAASHKELGELERAEELAREALELARLAADGADPQNAAQLLAQPINELVSVLCFRSEYENAEATAREALELTASLPAPGARRIVALEQLARIRDARGDFSEAVILNREAINLRRSRFGEMHPGQLGTLNNLGSSLRRSGELEAAEQAYGEALNLYRHNFGDRNRPRVLPALINNLATVAFQLGKLERAESLYREGQDVILESLGEGHVLTLHFALRLARIDIRQGEEGVDQRLRQLMAFWRPKLGDDHWRIHDARGVLGEALSFQGRCDEAEPLVVKSFEGLLEGASTQNQRRALERLREHFERCDQPWAAAPFEQRLEAELETGG